MAEHRQGRKLPLRDHADIGSDIGRGYQDKLIALIHVSAHHFGRSSTELLDQARIDIELYHLAFPIALEAVMKREVPSISKTKHLKNTVLREVAADLLRHSHPHMFGQLLGSAHVGRDLRNRLQYQVQI